MSTTASTLDRVAGRISAPLFAAVSLARHARAFLPRGRTFVAHTLRHPDLTLDLEPLAERLVGDALVRFSSHGCVVRFRHDPSETGETGDLDLPFAMPVAPARTNVEDYLANDYYAASPFDVGLVHAIHCRLRPERPSRHVIGDRDARIDDAVARGVASLEVDVSASPWGTWSPIVRVALLRTAADREALRFAPPRKLVHALRRGADAMSQWARPRTVP